MLKKKYSFGLKHYPTVGRPYQAHSTKVKIIVFIIGFSSFYVFYLVFNELRNKEELAKIISDWHVWFVFFSFLGQRAYYLRKVVSKKYENIPDIGSLSVIMIYLYSHSWLLLLLSIIVNRIVSAYFGARRLHAIIFNFGKDNWSTTYSILAVKLILKYFPYQEIGILLYALLLSTLTNEFSNFLVAYIIAQSNNKRFTNVLKEYINWKNDFWDVILGDVLILLESLQADFILFYLILLGLYLEIWIDLESIFRDNLKIRIKNREKSDISILLKGLIHDLKNIEQNTIYLIDQFLKYNKENKHLNRLKYNLDHQNQLMKLILTLESNSSKKIKNIKLKELLGEIIPYLIIGLKARKIKFSNRIDENIILKATKIDIIRLFINLIENSIQAIEGEGNIDIISSETEKDWIIEVKDNGKGIENNIKNKLFTPFFSTKDKGTGLGLIVCKKIMESYEGTLNNFFLKTVFGRQKSTYYFLWKFDKIWPLLK